MGYHQLFDRGDICSLIDLLFASPEVLAKNGNKHGNVIIIIIIIIIITEDQQTSVLQNTPPDNDILNVYTLEHPSITFLSHFFLQCYFHYLV